MRPSVICFGVGTGFATVSNVGYGSRCGRAEKKGACSMNEYCKYCGLEYNDARSLVLNSCIRNSICGVKHSPVR